MNDLINRNEVKVEFCPTNMMISDYMTKPLTGERFNDFRKKIMNM